MIATYNFAYQFINKLLKYFFDLLYHRFAWTYDFVSAAVSIGMWHEWMYSVLPNLNGPRVLELGYGPGHLQSAIRQHSINSFGIDQSKEMATIASQRLRDDGFSSYLTIGIAQFLPFKKCTFQQVVTTFPTEYIIDPLTLEETWRVLKPGGALVVLPVAWITGKNGLHRIADWLFRITGQSPEWDDQFLEPFHEAGFITQVKQMIFKSSNLVIIIAKKAKSEEM